MTDIRNPRQWEPVTAQLQNRPGERSPDLLRAVLAQFDVLGNPRYRRTADATFCNIFVWDATRALHCEIPHWVDDPKRPGAKRELNANATHDWLVVVGLEHGWRRCKDDFTASSAASAGYPTVAVWKNPNAGHSGHIAMLMPRKGGPRIAQAGAKNLFDAPLAIGFGLVKPVRFFTHD